MWTTDYRHHVNYRSQTPCELQTTDTMWTKDHRHDMNNKHHIVLNGQQQHLQFRSQGNRNHVNYRLQTPCELQITDTMWTTDHRHHVNQRLQTLCELQIIDTMWTTDHRHCMNNKHYIGLNGQHQHLQVRGQGNRDATDTTWITDHIHNVNYRSQALYEQQTLYRSQWTTTTLTVPQSRRPWRNRHYDIYRPQTLCELILDHRPQTRYKLQTLKAPMDYNNNNTTNTVINYWHFLHGPHQYLHPRAT